MQGYAYILTHPGTPSVFFDHVFSSYEHEIRRLISLRRQNMIHCRSTVSAFYTFGNKICLLCCTRLSNHILKKLKTFQCLYLYFLKEKNNLPEYLLYLGKRGTKTWKYRYGTLLFRLFFHLANKVFLMVFVCQYCLL
jgi:hypothetical protein